MENIEKCKRRIDNYNCMDVYFTFHKHISKSYSLSKDGNRFNLRKIDKNNLLKQLLKTNYPIYFDQYTPGPGNYSIIQNGQNLCFSNMGNKYGEPPNAGSHKLSNYHYNLKKAIETFDEPIENPISPRIDSYTNTQYVDLYTWKKEPVGVKFGTHWPKIKDITKDTIAYKHPNINIGMEIVSVSNSRGTILMKIRV